MSIKIMNQRSALRQLRKAERHVAEGAARIAEYECRVAELKRDGRDASNAKQLLRTLRKSQVLQGRHIKAIQAELAQGRRRENRQAGSTDRP